MLRSLIDEHARNERVEPNRPQPGVHGDKDVRALNLRQGAQDQQFLDVVRVLYRRKRMILTISILGALLATVVGLAIAPKYTAVAEMAVEPPQGSAGGRVLSPGEEIIIGTHIAMLSSRDQMERVLDSLSSETGAKTEAPAEIVAPSTDADAAADPTSNQPHGLSLTELASRLKLWIGIGGQSDMAVDAAPDPTSNQARSLSLAELARRLKLWSGVGGQSDMALNVEQLERNSKITQSGRSRVIRVAYTSQDPQRAATLANRIVQLYVDAQYEQKRAWMNSELARLDTRIGELRNEAEGTRATAQVLMTLLRRQDEIRGQVEFIAADVNVVSLAKTPERPSSSNPLLFILPALIICAIGVSLFAVIVDRLDRGLRSESDVSDALGIPCIGLVPKIARRNRARPHRYMLAHPFATYSEAIRSAAATLDIVAKNEESKVVLISSSVPMEGRSTLALSLAACVSALGHRVLLIDLDFRPRSLLGRLVPRTASEILDLQNRPPTECIQHNPDLGLDYLPMPRRGDPLALFTNEQMPRLLEEFRDKYDCVIIDGPPLLGMTEARLLPALADKVLFVVKWGERREVAQNALRLLRDAGCPDKEWSELPTAILTQVDLKRHAQYAFGDAGELMLKYRKHYTHSVKAWRSVAPAGGANSTARPGNDGRGHA